jgi:hypothetical protein
MKSKIATQKSQRRNVEHGIFPAVPAVQLDCSYADVCRELRVSAQLQRITS